MEDGILVCTSEGCQCLRTAGSIYCDRHEGEDGLLYPKEVYTELRGLDDKIDTLRARLARVEKERDEARARAADLEWQYQCAHCSAEVVEARAALATERERVERLRAGITLILAELSDADHVCAAWERTQSLDAARQMARTRVRFHHASWVHIDALEHGDLEDNGG